MKLHAAKFYPVLASLLIGATTAHAQTTAFGSQSLSSINETGIGLNFVGTGNGGFGTTSGAATLSLNQAAGVYYQDYWNNDATSSNVTSGSLGSLLNSANVATSVGVSFSGPNTWSTSGSSPYASFGGDGQLLNGYMDSNSGTAATATFSNVGYLTYNVFVYLMADGSNRTGKVSLTGATTGNSTFYWQTLDPSSSTAGTGLYGGYTKATSTTNGTYTSGNYVEFTGVTGTGFSIANNGVSNSDGIAGIQIVDASPEIVPEPSTWLLMGGGTLALLLVRRRRQTV